MSKDNYPDPDNPLDAIRPVFFSECHESLDVIEHGLLELGKGNNTQELVNAIFRGAHSIKGGAATFGYTGLADLTHVMETLLDKVRSAELAITADLIQVFLAAVDMLRDMVALMETGTTCDMSEAGLVKTSLAEFLQPRAQEISASAIPRQCLTVSTELPDTAATAATWHIRFSPHAGFFFSGSQPQHIFRALAGLGDITLKPLLDHLPGIESFRHDCMYLAWDICLTTTASLVQIREVFDWVELEADIAITPPAADTALAVATGEQNKVSAGTGENADESEGDALSVSTDGNAGHRDNFNDRRKTDRRSGKKDASSIRVDIEKVDILLNLVGELVINQSMLKLISRNHSNKNPGQIAAELEHGLGLLERTTRELQEAVMEIRMLPVSVSFMRFPRLVHDLSARLHKKVVLQISGESTEVDKTVLEKISDPLLHLIRNSLDHGIELPEVRLAQGKMETGKIRLSAAHEGGCVVIRVSDDGAGLNGIKILQKAVDKGLVAKDAQLTEREINDLVFSPGFSTVEAITEVSGRGVGMDVVRRNIEDIGGRVEVFSEPGKGTTFQITLPLTLAILDGQLIRVASEVYVMPLLSIVETVQVKAELLNLISGKQVVYRLRGKAIPVVDLRDLCRAGSTDAVTSYPGKQMIVVESDRRQVGLIVDELLDQHQVVIKSLETNFHKVPGLLGATILGDGTVALILDASSLADLLRNSLQEATPSGFALAAATLDTVRTRRPEQGNYSASHTITH